MLLRDRTRRRLRWFVIGLVVLVCAGGAAFVLRDRHLERQARAGRDAGLKLLEEGDYYHAMHSIGPYVRRHPDDVDVLFAYARARQQVPEPNQKHLSDALALLRRVLSLNPHHVAAAETLLKLYHQCGLNTELLQLSKDVLAIDSANRVALHSRAEALFALGNAAKDEPKDAAIKTSFEYNSRWPQDLEGHLLTLKIKRNADDGPKAVVAYAADLLKKSPNDPRFILLMAIAEAETGDIATAKKRLEQACTMEMPDAVAIQYLVQYCDALGMFSRSLEVLQRGATRGSDAEVDAMLAGRLWELKRYQELAQRFNVPAAGNAQAAALRCLALQQLGQRDQAKEALEGLQRAGASNPLARQWATVIDALGAAAEPDNKAIIRACEPAAREKDNPYLRYLSAEAYHRTGDSDAAFTSWRKAAMLSPAWSAPLERIARTSLSAGRAADAAQWAQAALDRLPGDPQSMLVLAAAQTLDLHAGDKTAAQKVLELLDRIEQIAPAEQAVRALRVQALASAGRKDDAIAAARQALQPAAKSSPAIILQLAGVSESLHLGIEQECLDACEKLHGLSAELAFVKARRDFDAGRHDDAVRSYQSARAAATAEKAAWDTGWARLLEIAADPRAKDAWISLADGNTSNDRLQWLAISAASAQGDRDFVRRVLDRLREHVGDSGLSWRLTQARWLLADQGNAQNQVQAALILNDLRRDAPDMLAAKLLLADCLIQMGNVSGAIDELNDAAKLQPQSSTIALQLARLLQSRGDLSRARLHLDRVMQNPTSDLAQCRDAAELIAAQGDAPAALEGLKRAYAAAIDQPPADMLLASLYRQTKQPERADAICKRLLEAPDAPRLAFVADFYVAQGRSADAAAVLARLETVKAGPGVKETMLGLHALRTGDPVKASEYFAAATRAAPANALAWRHLIRLKLIAAEDQAAMEIAQTAAAAAPRDAGIEAMRRQMPAIAKLKTAWPELPGLVADLLEMPQEEQTVIATIELLGNANARQVSERSFMNLTNLAAGHPKLFALQLLAARTAYERNRLDEAATISMRAAQSFPTQAAPASLAAESFAATRKWPQTIAAAQLWRERAPAQQLDADKLIALAHAQMGHFAPALAQLQPHLQQASADPERGQTVILLYANIQAHAGQLNEAANLLRPHLDRSEKWRGAWVQLALTSIDDREATATWLKEVEQHVPADAPQERIALIGSWQAFAAHTRDPKDAQAVRSLLNRVVEHDGTKLDATMTVQLGSLQELADDPAGAEASYRRALKAAPDQRVAMNNLAVLLAKTGQHLNEAHDLARRAATGDDPHLANFCDSLALVQAKMGNYREAVRSADRAVQLKPDNVNFLIRVGFLKAQDQDLNGARKVLRDIEALNPDAKSLSQDSLAMLNSLRHQVSASQS